MSMDMTLLPPPAVIETLDFEVILDRLKVRLAQLLPDLDLDLESEPALKLLQVMAYQEMLLRQRINDASRANMLAYATGTDLDHLAANFQVQRLVIDAGDPEAIPPVPPTMEADARLRERVQMALEGITTAGSRESYRFHALTASAEVADVGVDSPSPGLVRVTVLPIAEDGVASGALLDTVEAALNAEDVRPLTDAVQVQAATIIPQTIQATLYRNTGPSGDAGADAAHAELPVWLDSIRRLGAGLPRSGIFAALHQSGIARVALTEPAADVICDTTECVWVTSIDINEVVVTDA